ncbi:MAG: radical SAM protein [Deltaproteobacteria bacterium]|nr:radical SAM protein [Deltaproteobacteria bacterium]
MDDVPIRIEYLAAYIRDRVEQVDVIDLTKEKRPLTHYLEKQKPDLVGISVNYMSVHRTAQELAGIAKRHGAQVVVGGYQATALAELFAAHPDVDYVVRGEGEETLLELVRGRPLHEIKGLSYFQDGEVIHTADRPLIEDLDSIPFPERNRRRSAYTSPFMDLESDTTTAYDILITSRGCWGKCTFCVEPLMSRGKQRYRRPENVIQELEEIVRLHEGKKRLRVSISDPNFGGDPKVAEELCDHLIAFQARCKTNLRFFTSVRTNTIANNKRLAEKMVRSGMDYVFVGMESPRKRDLKAISKLGGSREKQERAAKYLKDSGAAVMSNFLLGLPGQTEEDILSLVDYAKELDLADAYFSVMTPLPGSKMYEEAKKNDQLLEKDFTKYRLWDMVVKHDKLSRKQVRELCVRCNAKWYNDLLLRQEHSRWKTNGKTKKKLYVYAGKFKALLDFVSVIGGSAGEKLHALEPSMFVKDMPNPWLGAFTRMNGVHHFLEMRRFLWILGEQKIQLSLKTGPEDSVSWVMKTNKGGLEYLDAINGTADDISIAINIPLDNGSPSPKQILGRVLRDNRDIRSRFNLTRLAAAAGSEVLACYVDRAIENVRYRARRIAIGSKDRIGRAYWKLPKIRLALKSSSAVQPE